MYRIRQLIQYIQNHYHKLDGYFLSISLSILLWWVLDYNWAYMVVTTLIIYFFHLYLHRNFKDYQYSIAGILSFMWGFVGYFLAYKILDYVRTKKDFNLGEPIVYITAIAVYGYSFYIHYHSFVVQPKKEGTYELTESLENIRKEKVAHRSLIISTITFILFLLVVVDTSPTGFTQQEWKIYQQHLKDEKEGKIIAKHRYVDRGPSVFEKADTNSKQLGYIRKATSYDKLLEWTSSQKQVNGMYFVEFTKVPEWWEFIIWDKKLRGSSGWFRIEDCTYIYGY
jgi:hypothetical protein